MSASYQEAPDADFAVIGDPVSHSLSPRMHQAAYAALGLPYRYVAIQVALGEVGAALDHLAERGYRGVNVTVPHKEEALNWARSAEGFAAKVRAANTVNLRERSCINTDAPGFLETLRPFGFERKSVLVLGAGGSARAIVAALVDDGWGVSIFNRTAAKAEELALSFGGTAVSCPDPNGASLIVNTTSASLQGEEIPCDWSQAPVGAVAYDLMYASEPTPFLRSASAHGLRMLDGLDLLVAQGALSFEWWLGIPAPRKAMKDALRRE
jgi:shikimate dehydrogenase